MLPAGRVLGQKYRIEAFVRRDGTGEVYRATQADGVGAAVMIRVLLPEYARDPKAVAHFQDELKKLRRMKDDDALPIYGEQLLEDGSTRYLVMEGVDGPSLTEVMAERKLSTAEVRELRDRLAQGLAAAHEKGIIHRDLSPDSVVLVGGRCERAKVVDFGIGKALESGDPAQATPDFPQRFAFAAPEQLGLSGGKVDARTDIYSLGLVIAAAAAGRPLRMGDTPATMVEARRKVPGLGTVPADLRDELAPLLAPEPKERPKSVRDLPKPAPKGKEAAQKAKAKPAGEGLSPAVVLGGAGVALVLAIAAAAYLFIPRSPEQIAAPTPAPVPAPAPPPATAAVEPPAPPAPAPPPAPPSVAPTPPPAPPASTEQTAALPPPSAPPAPEPPPPAPEPPAAAPPPPAPEPPVAAPTSPPAPPPAPPAASSPSPPESTAAVAPPSTPEPSGAPGRPGAPETSSPPGTEPPVAALPPADIGQPSMNDIADAVRLLFPGYPCSVLELNVTGATGVVAGFVSSAEELAQLKASIASFAGSAIRPDVQVLEKPFCGVAKVLQEKTRIRVPDISFNKPTKNYVDGEKLVLRVRTPQAGYLYVDYIDKAGTVVHMLPRPGRDSNRVQSGQVVTFGELPADERVYEIGEPYGSNMIAVVIANRPLFESPREEVEQSFEQYVGALQSALAADKEAIGGMVLFDTQQR